MEKRIQLKSGIILFVAMVLFGQANMKEGGTGLLAEWIGPTLLSFVLFAFVGPTVYVVASSIVRNPGEEIDYKQNHIGMERALVSASVTMLVIAVWQLIEW